MAPSNAAHISPVKPYAMASNTSSLDRLVDDLLIQILQASSVHAVLALRKTSRRYHMLTKLRCVWYVRFCADVLMRRLPPPGPPCPLSLFSAAELERRTLRALHLHRAWPCLSANTLVSGSHHRGAGAHVDQVVFIPGGTELLTVQGDKVVHWLIVSWPGFTQGLKYIGEWTPFEGVPCRVVKDGGVSGVIAVGPRNPSGFNRSAKVLSTSLKAPFVTLCDYAHVPGVVVGVWRHLLLLDTTRELEERGLQLLDWHAQSNGSALLPHLSELFGKFLDFVVFADHLLLVWEHCASVFPVPHVPTAGQVVVEHKRVFIFQEAISRPVGFTTCAARRVVPPSHLSHNAGTDASSDADWDWDLDRDGQHKHCASEMLGVSPTLAIAAQSGRRAESVSMMMLVPLVDEVDRVEDTGTFPYRLTCLPPYMAVTPQRRSGNDGGGDRALPPLRGCTALCLGASGRGMFVVGRELRLVSPGLVILPPYEMQIGPVFETGKALYVVDWEQQRRGDFVLMKDARTDGWNDEEGEDEDEDKDEVLACDRLDFDEGMGRFVVAKEHGGFEVVQLD